MSPPWPIRSVVAGAAGTTTMTLAYEAERRLRKHRQGPLDYDDSLVPGQIVASVMHLPHVTAREDHELGLALRWGYGSAFGIAHGLLHRRLREPWAAAAFGGMLMSATFTLSRCWVARRRPGAGRATCSRPAWGRTPRT